MANNPRAESLNLVVKLTGALGVPPSEVEQLVLDISALADEGVLVFGELRAFVSELRGAQDPQDACAAARVEVGKKPKKPQQQIAQQRVKKPRD